ncbi:putative leucine-rich repeat receptor-like serine/threonine-protein kinase At2g24130 [Triticum dicoccoides]|uniref:putative leucine-rich repeat receptor-like serine/threonine-protein kinase At2g24130 n=1 Tax=Triticum dicoccoides TaxID=85692 RepID=UPI00188E1730|nr:putative leucine-rich repeat receptor-like serine/threonine-protein kinase At2g24130 [Triticum dicoccoides]
MRAPMAVKLAAILLLLHLTRFHAMAVAMGERRAGTIVRQQRRWQVLLQEKATLLALKRSLTLPSPSALADWNESNDDVCGLTGVACDWRRQHVTGLSLGDMNISGPVPPVMGNLTRLKSLDMSRNFLAGQIPAELSNLRGLEVLDLGHNQLSGGIPLSLSELVSLGFLFLKDNQLSGPIPAVLFKNCTILSVVDFGNNDLSGEIPLEASENIFFLNLYSNRLTGKLPWWLANCTYLYLLDVEDNSLADELPSGIIAGKQQLKYLHLSNNYRFSSHDGNTNLEPFFAAVSNCSQILEIEAGAVGMGGRLPSWLGSLLPPNMSHLNLELNEIQGPIPADIGEMINIMLMNLSSNQLNGTVLASICALPKLERLSLSNNGLTGMIPACIGNATSLGELDLSGNALSGSILSGIGTGLVNLYLQNNQLSGEIPVNRLAECMRLLHLDLSNNSLTGEVPYMVSGTNIIFLNLSHNQIRGELPRGLGDMQQVQAIDLSWNNFTGTISPQLGLCRELEVLDLSHNSLTGVLPSSFDLLNDLKNLDVSHNSLNGEIPANLTKCTSLKHFNLSYNDFVGHVPTIGVFADFTFLSYIGNPRLCGSVVRRNCQRHRPWYQSRKYLVVMCVCAAVLTILCAVGAWKIQDWLAAVQEDMFRGRRSGGLSLVMKYKYPRITYQELVEATQEFSADRLVGAGSYSRVYRGTLRDGTMVAVKVLQLQSGNSIKSFSQECQVLKRIRHRNLMRIITVCSLADFKALVLPFMAKGSLERCLYAGPPAELSLVHRVNICSDIAEGVAYLHHHSPVKVIHCDLKPSNVLINDDMTALVSDFGISRLVMSVGGVANPADVGASTANMLCGSIGYIPPEYGYGSNPTTMGDVYSFGVLVMEMVTRKKPTDDMFEGGLSLHKWVKSHYHGRADAVVDQALARMVLDQTPEVRRMSDAAIGELLELGILCTQETASTRPSMLDAANELDRLKRHLGGDTTATFEDIDDLA